MYLITLLIGAVTYGLYRISTVKVVSPDDIIPPKKYRPVKAAAD